MKSEGKRWEENNKLRKSMKKMGESLEKAGREDWKKYEGEWVKGRD